MQDDRPAPERIPAGCKPKDLIYGDPDKVDDLVIELRAYAGAFDDGQGQLQVLTFKEWSGEGASAFEEATESLPKELSSANKHFLLAASALDAYADKLRSVQKRCTPIIEDADEARAASKRHWEDVEKYNAALERGDDPLPERPPESDPGATAMLKCIGRLDKLIEELQTVVDDSQRKLNKSAKEAPDKPKGWAAAKENAGDVWGGFKDGVDSLFGIVEPLSDGDVNGFAMQLAGMADGAAYAAQNPKEFAKAVANWDEWSRNPWRAAGQLTPDLLLALATGGGGALVRGGSAAKNALKRLTDRQKALSRDGSAGDRADGDPEKHDKCGSDKCTTGEPIDVATGEMVISATDVSLPGALPLVLGRSYVSGHTCGGWFGRTWAATLDQRLEMDDKGVVFVADDGMLLRYPVPRPDVETFPVSGPRWPLNWDGKPGGAMTIRMPERDRTLHFAPLPVADATELALCAVTDRNDHRITVEYSPEGLPTEIAHSGGYRIAVDTDPAKLRVTGLRLLGTGTNDRGVTLVSFVYNAAGDLTEAVNSTGEALRYTYDAEHRITAWADRNGTKFGYVYDRHGRVLRTVGSDGMMTGRLHYDDAARTTVYTDSLGHRTTYVYNEAFKVVAVTDPLGNTTHTEWDETNRLRLSVTDPLGNTTRYTYDDSGELRCVGRPDGTAGSAVYNDLGLPVEVREPDGALWRYTYDARGNRTSTTDPAGARTRYAYDGRGHLSAVTDALGHTTVIAANEAGLPMAVTDPLGHTTSVRRGPHGRITAMTDPLGNTTRQGWTIDGRPAWRERPDGKRETWAWDGEGNLVEHTDFAGNTTRHSHTHFDLPAARTESDGAQYTFAYDTELRLTQVTNPQGLTWSYEYDPAGRLTSETDFNGRLLRYTYDAAGRLASRTNGAGETLRFTRNALGQATTTRADDGTETVHTYDTVGRLIKAANPDVEILREYDAVGRLVAESVDGRTSAYTYDVRGHRTSRRTPVGARSEWTYDAEGRPAGLTTAGNRFDFAYDAAGREISRTFGDAVALTQGWDSVDRLTTQSLTGRPEAGPSLLQHRAYGYRADDHVTEIRELTSGTRRFDLDPTGRVVAVHAHGWTERYAYDNLGNLAHATTPGHPSAGDRDFSGTLIRRAGRTVYEHDTQGRLVRRTRKLLNGQQRTWTFTWNAEDRLTDATTPEGDHWQYSYDPLGRRTAKHRLAADGTVAERITFTWDGTRLAEQATQDGRTTTWDYAPGTHRPLAQVDRDTLTGGEARFHAVITDVVGTPTELVTPDGRIAWQHRTTVWGTDLPTPPGSASVGCPLRFPGQYRDPETGLNYNCFRYYDDEVAGYVSADPLGLSAAPNHHAFVPNPFGWLDPLGLKCLDPDDQVRHDSARDTAVDGDGNMMGEEDSPGVRMVDEVQLERIRLDLHAKLGEPEVKPTPKGNIEVWQLSDDPKATVTYRPFSKSGGATIDYNDVDGLDMKRFHIPQHGD
ncbi:putative T7SS-secreted protein [Streptomyces sp. NPDC006283]|uniref:putative T7SS-secreted protein n=1 Tax=Streptomyces sp. NPDC006283 TaxID=3156741 RepID=UPI0033A36B38